MFIPDSRVGNQLFVKGFKIPFISNLKKPAFASKLDVLKIASVKDAILYQIGCLGFVLFSIQPSVMP